MTGREWRGARTRERVPRPRGRAGPGGGSGCRVCTAGSPRPGASAWPGQPEERGLPIPNLGPPPLLYPLEGSSARSCCLKLSPLGGCKSVGEGALSRPLLAPLKPCSLVGCVTGLRCAGTSSLHPARIARGACSGAFSF